MKANELMIGDWVMFPNSIEKVQEVAYVEGKGYCASFAASATLFPISIDKIKPIHFTPEILEKNGFEKQQGYIGSVFAFDDDDKDAHVTIHPKEDNYTRGAYTYIHVEHGCLSLDELPLEYIHELQHVLKLCKIEKTIEL